MNKNITIDLRMINSSGIGTYIRSIAPLVIENLNKFNFYLIGNENELNYIEGIHKKNTKIITCTAPIYSIAEQVELVKKIPSKTNLFWSPHYNIPIFYSGNLLVTIHDVFHLAFPTYIKGFHKRAYSKFMFQCLKVKASKIITVSNFSKNEIIEYTNIGKDKIDVIYNGVDNHFFTECNKRKEEKPYILYVGNVKPHKNLLKLVEAYDKIKEQIPHDLVIVGKKEGFITGDSDVIEYANKLKDRIMFTGYITDDKLKEYYRNASVFVFPSLYEGFGLPPLEAMACKCPVIVSKLASMPEVCGNAAFYIDPQSVDEIAEGILRVLNDVKLSTDLIMKGYERAKMFSWEKAAIETIEVIKQIVE